MGNIVTCRVCKKKIDKSDATRAKLSYVCMGECTDTFIANHIEKGKNKKRIRQNKKRKQTSDLALTQTAFNKCIRIRDTYPSGSCISCGRKITYGSATCHAGHMYTRGARSDLRFNENNAFGQCQNCNNFGDTETAIEFKKNVIERIGQKEYDKLSIRTQQDYSDKNLKVIRLECLKKIKKLGG